MGSHVEAWARGYGEGREACAATVDPERELKVDSGEPPMAWVADARRASWAGLDCRRVFGPGRHSRGFCRTFSTGWMGCDNSFMSSETFT
jgi:hypothetical protein